MVNFKTLFPIICVSVLGATGVGVVYWRRDIEIKEAEKERQQEEQKKEETEQKTKET